VGSSSNLRLRPDLSPIIDVYVSDILDEASPLAVEESGFGAQRLSQPVEGLYHKLLESIRVFRVFCSDMS
jgi:hypothetical protein